MWSDWDGRPQAELDHGIRLDTNYYYWPGSWVGDRPGLFTGSGFPQRFADADGSLIDIYQSTTQLNDELYNDPRPEACRPRLDSLQGAARQRGGRNPGYYGVFTANNHNDLGVVPGGDAVEAAARSHGVKVISPSSC